MNIFEISSGTRVYFRGGSTQYVYFTDWWWLLRDAGAPLHKVRSESYTIPNAFIDIDKIQPMGNEVGTIFRIVPRYEIPE